MDRQEGGGGGGVEGWGWVGSWGPLAALYAHTSAHLAPVKDPQTLPALMTPGVERPSSTLAHRASTVGGVDALSPSR